MKKINITLTIPELVKRKDLEKRIRKSAKETNLGKINFQAVNRDLIDFYGVDVVVYTGKPRKLLKADPKRDLGYLRQDEYRGNKWTEASFLLADSLEKGIKQKFLTWLRKQKLNPGFLHHIGPQLSPLNLPEYGSKEAREIYLRKMKKTKQ